MSKKLNSYELLRGLVNITQFAFLVLGPILLCLFVSVFIKTKFLTGDWVVVVGILVGVLSSAVSCVDFAKKYLKRIKDNKEKAK
ncbi:MAG: AtpZ/AtpI family protein [Oscillospiraceae bacterium]